MRELTDAARLRRRCLRRVARLASPAHFIPELPGWRDRSPFVLREGSINFHHYDFYAQALAKTERTHARDLEDVREMAARGLVEPARLLEFFEQIAPGLYRYPAIDPASFRRAVERIAEHDRDRWGARLCRDQRVRLIAPAP
jgi:hypothetical protein